MHVRNAGLQSHNVWGATHKNRTHTLTRMACANPPPPPAVPTKPGVSSVVAAPPPPDPGFHYYDEERSDSCLRGFLALYDQQLLCDVTLVAQGQDFQCHRAMLAASSPYFQVHLRLNGFIESV